MNAALLLAIWRAECERAPALLDVASGFKNKGLRFDERALMRIGAAIERLAAAPLPAADTITLGAIETDEGSALSFTEASRKFAPGMPEQTR